MRLSLTYVEFIQSAARIHGVSEQSVKLWLQRQLNKTETELLITDTGFGPVSADSRLN